MSTENQRTAWCFLHDGVRAGLPGSLWVTRLTPPHLGSLTTTRGRTKGCQPSSKPMDTPSYDGVSCPRAQGTGQSLGCKDRMGPTRCPGTPAPAPPSGAPCRTSICRAQSPPTPDRGEDTRWTEYLPERSSRKRSPDTFVQTHRADHTRTGSCVHCGLG